MTALFEQENIAALVDAFYVAVRADDMLAPIFSTKIAPDAWQIHTQHITNFWSSILLKTGQFSGNPMRKHFELNGLTPQHFERWLFLFEQTAIRLLSAEQSAAITQIAKRIADSFQMGLAFNYDRTETGINPFACYSPLTQSRKTGRAG